MYWDAHDKVHNSFSHGSFFINCRLDTVLWLIIRQLHLFLGTARSVWRRWVLSGGVLFAVILSTMFFELITPWAPVAALMTCKRLLSQMCSLVSDEMWSFNERALTLSADMWTNMKVNSTSVTCQLTALWCWIRAVRVAALVHVTCETHIYTATSWPDYQLSNTAKTHSE